MASLLGWMKTRLVYLNRLGRQQCLITKSNKHQFFFSPLSGSFAFLSDFRDAEQTMYLKTQYNCFYTRNKIFSTIHNSLALRSGDTLTNDRLERWCYC